MATPFTPDRAEQLEELDNRLPPAQRLRILEEARDGLLAGKKTLRFRSGDEEIEYQQIDLPALERRIAELRLLIAPPQPNALPFGVIIPRFKSGF